MRTRAALATTQNESVRNVPVKASAGLFSSGLLSLQFLKIQECVSSDKLLRLMTNRRSNSGHRSRANHSLPIFPRMHKPKWTSMGKIKGPKWDSGGV